MQTPCSQNRQSTGRRPPSPPAPFPRSALWPSAARRLPITWTQCTNSTWRPRLSWWTMARASSRPDLPERYVCMRVCLCVRARERAVPVHDSTRARFHLSACLSRFVARARALSLSLSHARSLARSLALSLPPSLTHSLILSLSLSCSLALLLSRSLELSRTLSLPCAPA